MNSPIINKAGAIFIPVSDLKKAMAWYSNILGLEVREENIIDHLYIIPMQGTNSNLVLDSQIYSQANLHSVPAFHFNTDDIQASYQFMRQQGVELLTEIEHGQWFNFRDPDGNALMVCMC